MSDFSYTEDRARYVNSMKLAMHFHSRGMSISDVTKMHPNVRKHHAQMAGVNEVSNEGWTSTLHHLSALHQMNTMEQPSKEQKPDEGGKK